jgi:hypothetical protein
MSQADTEYWTLSPPDQPRLSIDGLLPHMVLPARENGGMPLTGTVKPLWIHTQ